MVSVDSNPMTNVAPLRRVLRRAFGAFSVAVATLAVEANGPGLAEAASGGFGPASQVSISCVYAETLARPRLAVRCTGKPLSCQRMAVRSSHLR